MKPRFLLLTVLLTMAASAQSPPSLDTAKPPDAAAKPADDPYVKKGPGDAPAPASPFLGGPYANAPFEAPPHHLLMTFETYRLPQAALDALLEAGADTTMYDGLRKLAQGGQAELETLISVPTRSGQRVTVESVDEFAYASEFNSPTTAVQYGFPTAIAMRPLGDRIELDPVESAEGGIVDMNVWQEITKLTGFSVVKSGELSEGVVQPLFSLRKFQNIVRSRIGVPTFCGTLSEPHGTGVEGGDGDGSVSVTFVRTSLCPTTPSATPADKPEKKEEDLERSNIRLVFRFYSLPREKAREFLAETADGEKLHAKLIGLPAQDLKMERLLSVITHSGNRAVVNETTEWLAGNETDPPEAWNEEEAEAEKGGDKAQAAAKPAASAAALRGEDRPKFIPAGVTTFECRPVGWQVELDPVLGRDARTVDVNLVPSYTQYRGLIQGHPLLARCPDQALFSSQKIYTVLTATVGKQCFLGTMSPPRNTGANGRKDDGRTWFGFIKVTIER